MFRLTLAAIGVGLPALTTAQDPTGEKALAGTWELVAGELGGRKMPEAVTRTLTLVIDGDKYTVRSPGPDDTGTVRRDPTKTPRELDVTGAAGPNKGRMFPAIYKLDGDSLTVCYDLSGRARPTAFRSEPGTKDFLAVYKLKKP